MRIRAVSPPGVSFQDCFLVQLRQPLATSLPRQLLPSLTPVMDTPPTLMHLKMGFAHAAFCHGVIL